ncbi:MAG TPA: DUF2961 domain-containing protein [Candidatus Paceibacterota bacterium]|nr:DUF2961 domain-containing protein [Verrucomicrobiota bacterium]HSA11372.1 DUF2961 domain-containing protein [Candidatus Paceibacterota bacterium]
MIASRTIRPAILLPGILALLLPVQATQAQSLDCLLHLQKFTAHRVSSSDPSSGNMDMRRVNAGQSLTLANLEGPGVITHIWFTHLYPSRSALRKLVLRIYFDDPAEPCVESPLGDFFGLGHAQTYSYASQPLAAGTHGGLNSYWPMPFKKMARLTIANEGAQDCSALYFQVDYRKLEQPLPDGLHFFAAYRQAFPPQKGKPYLILQTDGGQGHFAGCNLSVEQRDESWWGEGDFAIYVDGETKPSIAGTGSEDDFGGAWCYSHEFGYAQFGAPLRGRFNQAGILEHCTADLKGKDLNQWRWPEAWKPGDLWNVYRYHLADPVPFRKSLLVNIEHGWQGNERSDWYSSVAYWYQTGRPSARAELPSVQDRMPHYLRPHDHGGGRWEGEDLVDAATTTGGKVEEAGMAFWGDLFSGQYALQWDAVQTNATLTLPFSIAKAGRYRVVTRLSRSEPGGTFALQLDDLKPTDPINLHQPTPIPGLFETGPAEAELTAGPHVLKFVSLCPDQRAKGNRLLLDKFQLSEARK